MKTPIVLFPGQGSQCSGMGRALAEADSACMDLWKTAERISKLPLREIFWDGDEAAMSQTNALQPALTVVNCTLWNAVRQYVDPIGAAGHSLGEFSALACAHVLDIEDVLAITSLRGALMQQADPDQTGAMTAVVKLDVETLQNIVAEVRAECGELLLCANFNTPVQTVLSGTKKALACAQGKIKEKKGRALPLKVSAAFHSPMMEEANREFIPQLEKLSWRTPRFPIYCNVDGRPASDGAAIKERICRQMVSPVLWVDTIRNQYAAGAREWLEVGPKSLLVKMVAPCLPAGAETPETLVVSSREDLSALEARD